jgi:signal transduction histidine kinase
MLRFHFATEYLSEEEPARKPLLKALSLADEVFVEARRRIEYLRDEVPEGTNFADQLAKLGEELEIARVMTFRVVENGQVQDLNPDVQVELYKIVREALVNTLHHSKAVSAEVSLIYEPSQFLMKCCDTGVGLPAAILSSGSRTGHWGLVGMKERVSAIDGKLELWSVPGGGTDIEVHVPARRAYRFPTTRFIWLQRLLQFRRNATGRDVTQ